MSRETQWRQIKILEYNMMSTEGTSGDLWKLKVRILKAPPYRDNYGQNWTQSSKDFNFLINYRTVTSLETCGEIQETLGYRDTKRRWYPTFPSINNTEQTQEPVNEMNCCQTFNDTRNRIQWDGGSSLQGRFMRSSTVKKKSSKSNSGISN